MDGSDLYVMYMLFLQISKSGSGCLSSLVRGMNIGVVLLHWDTAEWCAVVLLSLLFLTNLFSTFLPCHSDSGHIHHSMLLSTL